MASDLSRCVVAQLPQVGNEDKHALLRDFQRVLSSILLAIYHSYITRIKGNSLYLSIPWSSSSPRIFHTISSVRKHMPSIWYVQIVCPTMSSIGHTFHNHQSPDSDYSRAHHEWVRTSNRRYRSKQHGPTAEQITDEHAHRLCVQQPTQRPTTFINSVVLWELNWFCTASSFTPLPLWRTHEPVPCIDAASALSRLPTFILIHLHTNVTTEQWAMQKNRHVLIFSDPKRSDNDR